MRRLALALLLVLAVTACKKKEAAAASDAAAVLVAPSSVRPLYRQAGAAGSPTLRQGLWAASPPGCAFDDSASSGAWPKCATWWVVRPGSMIIREGGQDSGELQTKAYLLAPGLPRILQTKAGSFDPYSYSGLRQLAADEQGRITRARIWTVDCAAQSTPSSDSQVAAEDPCWMRSQGQVRASIIAAERSAKDSMEIHWVREAEH